MGEGGIEALTCFILEAELDTHHSSRKGSPYYVVTPFPMNYPMNAGRTVNPRANNCHFRGEKIAISTILVDRLWIPLWKITAVHIASDHSSDCLFSGRPIVSQIPWGDEQRYCGE